MNHKIKVLEVRNYLVREGRRNDFIDLFQANFTASQNELGGYIVGQYRVSGANNNFLWMRGFEDMGARSKFLNDFYYHSPHWKQNKSAANAMLLNNDNVQLLRPLSLKESLSAGFDTKWFAREKGIAVIDLFTSNTKLQKLIEFMTAKYDRLLDKEQKANTSFWISEPTHNDFPALPVFQDKNLLVRITFYKSEADHHTKMTGIDSKMTDELKTEMADLVTIKTTLVLTPTPASRRSQN
jgi:hypothetical protein